MDRPIRIAAFASSTRTGSVNRQLLDKAVEAIEHSGGEGVDVDVIDLRKLPLPIYDADAQTRDGIPMAAEHFHERVDASDAVMVANPEYNGGYPALFKNTVDWASRIDMFLFHTRYVGLLAATPGRGGGVRGAAHTRALFENMFVPVHPEAYTLPDAKNALADEAWPASADADRLGAWASEFLAGAIAHAESRSDAQE